MANKNILLAVLACVLTMGSVLPAAAPKVAPLIAGVTLYDNSLVV
jgi:hypothetical protein